MIDPQSGASTQNTQLIHASPEALYQAFTDPAALEVWLVPGDMTGKIHDFDHRVGGGYQMSLYYPSSSPDARGKTAEKEDRYTARFVELNPPKRIVEAITFDTDDPAFSGEMTMVVTLEPRENGTSVTIAFKDIPPGIRPADNEAGTQSSLEKLARYVQQEAGRSG
ncbi:MAG: ATPase [Chloroflexi bacterium]|nr:MAG: ATPase [Chloroflexota bacterium]